MAERVVTDAVLCGWRVHADLPLPELAPWTGPDIPADVVIQRGAVPEWLADPVLATPFVEIDADQRCLVRLPQVGRYFLADGRRIVVAPAPAADASEIALFLLGTVFALLCHRRGLYPLHASCVEIGGGAVAFAGGTGVGKSTIAALLAQRGLAVLADDVCVIADAAVLPSFPGLKLWRDSLDALAIPEADRQPVRPALPKFRYFPKPAFRSGPVPLQAIVLLQEMDRIEGGERLGTVAALQSLRRQVCRLRLARALGASPALFAAETRIVAAVPVFRLALRRDFSRAAAMVETIMRLLPA